TWPVTPPLLYFMRSPDGWCSATTGVPLASGSARHAAKRVPAGGACFRRTSAQSLSWPRASIAAPPLNCTNGGDALLLHVAARKKKYALSVLAAACEPMQ